MNIKNVAIMAVIDLIGNMTCEDVYDALEYWDADLICELMDELQKLGQFDAVSVLKYSVLARIAPAHYTARYG